MTMTETGKNEEAAELPLEGSPNRKPVDDNSEVGQEGGLDNAPSGVALMRTPTSSKVLDADIFKTPEALTPTSSAKKRKRLTPEEKNLREKERQDKRRKVEEEKQKKEEERVKREQDKLEKAKQKEAERVKREEERVKKEEEKLKIEEEKKQEKLKKEEERLKREEERKKIEEEKKQERLKKEEERKKKEDERKQKELEKERERIKIEEKKAKQAQLFTNFFQKSPAPKVQTIIDDGSGCIRVKEPDADFLGAEAGRNSALFNPLPFQIKTDMAVAPLVRREKLSGEERQVLDSLFNNGSGGSDVTGVFFRSIKCGKGRKFGRTDLVVVKDSPDIQILDEPSSKPLGCFKWRIKLLQFEENRRPAYWGTWKKENKKVTARRPFIKEEEVDYDFDSDDEWEDEPEDAEEIGDSDKDEGEEKEEGGDEEEDEEGWMVPHGYLSDSEREGTNEDLESLKCKEKEFYMSLKEKAMISLPYIFTDNLSCYTMRLFGRAPPVKIPVRRKPKAPVPRRKIEQTEHVKPTQTAAPPVVETPPPTDKPVNQRKSVRTPKIVDKKPNPYATPPSGFLAMNLPSDDDEEDMDWEELESSSSSDSGSENSEVEKSDSDDDLFIPVVPSKSKN